MTTEEVLVATRDLIQKGWTQNVYARDANGRMVPYGGPGAVCWCLSGALHTVTLGNPNVRFMEAHAAIKAVIGWPMAPWNDQPERTQQDVLDAIDKALAIVRGSGKVEA